MKRYIEITAFVLSIILLLFSGKYFIKNGIVEAFVPPYTVDISGDYNNIADDERVDQFIENFKKNPIPETLFTTNAQGDLTFEGIETLGVDKLSYINGGFATDFGCYIMHLKDNNSFRYQWINMLEKGNVTLVVKNLSGEVVYENDEENASIQGRLQLPAGYYFIYVKSDNDSDMKFRFYLAQEI